MAQLNDLHLENMQFMYETFPPNLPGGGENVSWWLDFVQLNNMGWSFHVVVQEGNGTRYIAYRDEKRMEGREMQPLLHSALLETEKEWQTNPGVALLRQTGWRSRQVGGMFYLQRNAHIEPVYVTAQAAWAALERRGYEDSHV